MSERFIEVKWWQAVLVGLAFAVVILAGAALGAFMALRMHGLI